MDSDKSLDLDLEMESICNSNNKRLCEDDCDEDLMDLQVKKQRRLDENQRDMVVVELNQETKTGATSAHDYFEFIKTSGADADEFNAAMIDGMQSKNSPTQNNGPAEGDRDITGQQYYIAVDARTVATLQAGAEYTLVPIDQNGKETPEERQPNAYDEENSRLWSENDDSLKESDQPQQLLIQTMRPLSSNPSSPQLYCQEDGNNIINGGQGSDNDGLGSSNVYSNVDGSLSPNRKFHSNNTHGQNVVRGSNMPTRFQTPTSVSPNGYPVLPAPHLMYNVPSAAHHPNNSSAPFSYAGHRVHLPPPGSTWHTSPYTQSYSPHNNQNFVPNQTMTPTSTMNLNSSGEEQENVSPDYSRVAQNASGGDGSLFPLTALPRTPNMAQILGPLDNMQYFPIPFTGRENHNEKERKRRSRIKNACSLLRDLVPGLSEKTDKATVFEYTVQYLLHLKRHVGKQFDKDFMEKYTPY
uniref:BHLH domain-containing protein n=1 Tax=Strigamia maritima TaxID=126957 RepID=T1JIZ4_STRMM